MQFTFPADWWRAWWFDPLSATAFFAVAIHVYWREERIRGLSSVSALSELSFDLHPDRSPVFASFVAYWMGIYLWKAFVPPPGDIHDGVPDDFTSFLYLVAEVASGVFAYDFLFFFVHLAMHEFPLPSLGSLHRRHHRSPSRHLEARDVLRHSIADGSIQVIMNILVQRRTPWGAIKSRLARVIHNLVVTWMLTESHTASPVPNVFRRRWFVGVRDHRIHHLGCGKHRRYQQFFGYLDDICEWMHSCGVCRVNVCKH